MPAPTSGRSPPPPWSAAAGRGAERRRPQADLCRPPGARLRGGAPPATTGAAPHLRVRHLRGKDVASPHEHDRRLPWLRAPPDGSPPPPDGTPPDLQLQTVVLRVGMSCEGCVGAVKRVLGKMEGVESYKVDIKEQKVIVKGNVTPNAVLQTVSKTGKKTSFWEAEPTAPADATA